MRPSLLTVLFVAAACGRSGEESAQSSAKALQDALRSGRVDSEEMKDLAGKLPQTEWGGEDPASVVLDDTLIQKWLQVDKEMLELFGPAALNMDQLEDYQKGRQTVLKRNGLSQMEYLVVESRMTAARYAVQMDRVPPELESDCARYRAWQEEIEEVEGLRLEKLRAARR